MKYLEAIGMRYESATFPPKKRMNSHAKSEQVSGFVNQIIYMPMKQRAMKTTAVGAEYPEK